SGVLGLGGYTLNSEEPLCTHYALRTLIGEVALEFGEDPLRVSFTRTLRAARRSMAGQPGFSP
ncbi:MAG: hypothetical protein ACTH26_14800, partial [Glutamicibacter arilaitensis]